MLDIDIGKAHIGVGMVHRGKLPAPAKDSVAEHDLVSEVYHIIDGSATLVTSPDIVGMKRRPATLDDIPDRAIDESLVSIDTSPLRSAAMPDPS